MSARTKQSMIQQALLGFTLLICLGLFLVPPNTPDEGETRSHGAISAAPSTALMSPANLEGQSP